jgi:hypothetical protein
MLGAVLASRPALLSGLPGALGALGGIEYGAFTRPRATGLVSTISEASFEFHDACLCAMYFSMPCSENRSRRGETRTVNGSRSAFLYNQLTLTESFSAA